MEGAHIKAIVIIGFLAFASLVARVWLGDSRRRGPAPEVSQAMLRQAASNPDSPGGRVRAAHLRAMERKAERAMEEGAAAKPVEEPHMLGAFYPEEHAQAPASESSMLLPAIGAGVGGLGVFGVAGLGVWMLMGRKEDDAGIMLDAPAEGEVSRSADPRAHAHAEQPAPPEGT